MPTYREFPIGLATRGHLRRLMAAFRPTWCTWPRRPGSATRRARRRAASGSPSVAVYQTDLIGFAERYPFPGAAGAMRTLTRRVHGPADRNLVPQHRERRPARRPRHRPACTAGAAAWTPSCSPRTGATSACAASSGDGDLLVGYVGRLAAEKELELLAHLHDVPGVRLVLVGGGPEEQRLRTPASRGRAARCPARRGPGRGRRLARRVRAHRSHRDVLPVRPGGAGVRSPGGRAARRRTGRPGAATARTASSTGPVTGPSCGGWSSTSPRTRRCDGRWGRAPWPAYATGRGRPSTTSWSSTTSRYARPKTLPTAACTSSRGRAEAVRFPPARRT